MGPFLDEGYIVSGREVLYALDKPGLLLFDGGQGDGQHCCKSPVGVRARHAVIIALSWLADERAMESLTRLLEDDDWMMREWAAVGLGARGVFQRFATRLRVLSTPRSALEKNAYATLNIRD